MVIPTASSIPVEVCETYRQAFAMLGCLHVDFLDIRTREEAEAPDALALVRAADCVMFTGGINLRLPILLGIPCCTKF